LKEERERMSIWGVMVDRREREGVIEYSWDGARVYRLPVESYPGHITNVYLILDGGRPVLVDTGLGPKGREDLARSFETLRREFGRDVGLAEVRDIVITHGHADHWGLLAFPEFAGKRIFIHTRDTRVLRDFQEVYRAARDRIRRFVSEAGWDLPMDNIFELDRLRVDS